MSNKHLNCIIVFVFFLSLASCNHFNTKEAVKVNDEVVHYQKKLSYTLAEFVASLEGRDEVMITEALSRLKVASDSGLTVVSEMVSPDCNESFLAAAKALFNYYSTASETDYAHIANYYSADSISYEAYDSLEILVKNFKQEQDNVNQAFLSAQQNFAKDCGFKLIENED